MSFLVHIKPPKNCTGPSRDALSLLLLRTAERFGLQGMQDWSVDLKRGQSILGIESEFHDLSFLREADEAFILYFAVLSRAKEYARLIRTSIPELLVTNPKKAARVNWVKRWKRYYKPVPISANEHTNKLWVLPEWKKRKAKANEILLKIRPGQAFGTGTHPTTQLCLALFLGITYRDLRKKKLQALDFGAGTGILAIASLLWSKSHRILLKAICIEIDRTAHDSLRTNLRLNRVKAKITTQLSKEKADLIFANVLAPVLLEHQRILWSHVRSGGFLILSGILATEAPAFLAQFLPQETFRQRGIKRSGDWVAVLLQKK